MANSKEQKHQPKDLDINSITQLEAGSETLILYKELVKKQNGNLMVLIHPFFLDFDTIETIFNELEPKKFADSDTSRKAVEGDLTTSKITNIGYYFRLKKFLTHPNTKLIVVGEHESNLLKTFLFLKKMGYSGNILYYKTQWQALFQHLMKVIGTP